MIRPLFFWACIAVLALGACQSAPDPIRVGIDQCDHCRMQITDPRFGGEIITAKGRVLKFDSLSCLTGFLAETREKPRQVLVSDFLHPGTLVPAEQAYFLRSAGLKSPMGAGVAASADESGLRKMRSATQGDLVRWDKLASSP